jgi:hypothetical protein
MDGRSEKVEAKKQRFSLRGASRNDFGVRLVPQLVPEAHPDSPVRHSALLIVFGDVAGRVK